MMEFLEGGGRTVGRCRGRVPEEAIADDVDERETRRLHDAIFDVLEGLEQGPEVSQLDR